MRRLTHLSCDVQVNPALLVVVTELPGTEIFIAVAAPLIAVLTLCRPSRNRCLPII